MSDDEKRLSELLALLEQTPDDPRVRRELDELLSQSPDLVTAYVDQTLIDSALKWYLQTDTHPATVGTTPGESETIGAARHSTEFSTVGHSNPAETQPWGGQPQSRSLSPVRRGLMRRRQFATAAAVAVGGCLLGAIFHDRLSIFGQQVATVTAADAPRTWNSLRVGRGLGVGPVSVPDGVKASFRFTSGAILRCQGPAEFDIRAANLVHLNYGRLTARCDNVPAGFTVSTDQLDVIDRGTEFGVSVDAGQNTDIAVFDGLVSLRSPTGPVPKAVRSLPGGSGIRMTAPKRFHRLHQIYRDYDAADWSTNVAGTSLFARLEDNLRTADSHKFYEIVAGGLREDSRAYVDRKYEWNGVTSEGMPGFLRGADLVRTFNDDKLKKGSYSLTVEMCETCVLFVLWDKRAIPQPWLTDQFVETGHIIGMDEDGTRYNKTNRIEKGPGLGVEVDYSVWAAVVPGGELVSLGGIGDTYTNKWRVSMYGLAAQPLDACGPLTELLGLE